ncbi:MAG: transposase, partial [Bryobacteraceae bacterium]
MRPPYSSGTNYASFFSDGTLERKPPRRLVQVFRGGSCVPLTDRDQNPALLPQLSSAGSLFSVEELSTLYSLRWVVELLFKTLKS